MPPMRIKVRCLDCRRTFEGYSVATLTKADKHADKLEHELVATRPDGSVYCTIKPSKPQEFETR